MPTIRSDLSPSRLRLRTLHLILSQPEQHNIQGLADALGEPYQRVRDAVADIESEFGVLRIGQSQALRAVLPGETVMVG